MVGAQRRKKKVSKNKKKNWRKHSNIQDVEEFIDDVRLQERTGGLVSKKKDSELFVLDRNSSAIKKETAAERRARKKLPKQLACHALLLPDPSVKSPKVPKIGRKSDPAKVLEKVLKKKARQTENDKANVAEKKKALESYTQSGCTRKEYDLWTDEKVLVDKESEAIDEIDEGHFSKITGRRRVKVPPKFLEKPSARSAIDTPHPGTSYNPTFDDHQELLRSALDIELAKEKEKEKIIRALDAKFPNKPVTEAMYLKEMSEGLKEAQDESKDADTQEKNESDEEVTDELIWKPKPTKLKTKSKRNKQERQKAFEEMKRKEKEAKKKANEIFHLKRIKNELTEGEKKSLELQDKRKEEKERKRFEAKRMGPMKYEEPEIDLQLSSELKGSLRRLVPEGSIFTDRFRSLQKRNIIEPRLPAKRPKGKRKSTKKYEKPSHKAVTI